MSQGFPPPPFVSFAPHEADWAEAMARGAPPFERWRHPAFRTGNADASSERTAKQWVEATCKGAPGRAAELLAVLEIDLAGVARAFGPARIAPDQPLPGWAACLVQAIRALPAKHANEPGEDPTSAGIRAFIAVARQLLDWDGLQARYACLAPEVLVALTRQLVTRILLACGATLELENTMRSVPTWDLGRDAWIERFCGFTGLNFVVGTAIRQWRQNALEILSRLATDLPLLQQTLFPGSPVGPLVSVEGDLGDRHNDGRSVAVLGFASGARVVYKPKDLRCARKFTELLGVLNAAGPSVELATRHILCRGGYAWEQHVAQRRAESGAEAARFFRRFGMLLRVLQLVEGRDFWIDNLRADGEWPVFIDLECILHPRVATAGERRFVGPHPALYEESVLATAAVTQPIEAPDFGPQDFGALSGPGFRILPLGMWNGYRDQGNGNIWLRGGRLYWAPDVEWPHADGRPAAANDHLGELETGYREMQDRLERSAAGLLGPAGPLAGIGDVPVRALMRSTWEYLVLLRASLEPNALLDGNSRELALASVIATVPDWGAGDAAAWRLGGCELDALRTLDIPEFYNLPSTTDAIDPSHRTIANVFVGTAHDRMTARLDDIASFDAEAHLDILRTAVRSMVRSPATE